MAMKRVVPLNYVTAEFCRCQGLKCDGRSSLHHHNDRLYCAFKQISRLVKGAVHYIERWLMTLSSLLDIAFKCLSWMSTTSNAVSVKIFYNFIIIHHLLSDGAMFSRSLISRCIFYPHFFFAARHDSSFVAKLISVRIPVMCSTSDPELCKLQHLDKSSLTSVLEGGPENWGVTGKTDGEMEKGLCRRFQ